ncbi:MAG: serine/threonine-protein kinase [Kofleriaceae bacterium]
MESPERYGAYFVYEQIGKGGMASVHRAERETKAGRQQIALKRAYPTLQREMVFLFLDEARLCRYLEHPNIARTYDSGRVFGTYYIAMEYVPGPTLRELVERCSVTVGSVPESITLHLAQQLCDALDAAHNCCDDKGAPLNIVHRDVTPANIIISDAGVLKLIDFGLAKATGTTQQTAVGVIKGKFGYIAPEYLNGKLDHRADLWAIGIIMYELLTSRRLFDGPNAFETMMRVRELPIPRPSLANPNVTPELDEIVMKALERDPERRWQSAALMRDRIRAVIAKFGGPIDSDAVVEWVRQVFEQEPGRPPQLTPIIPMPFAQLLYPIGDEEATVISGPPTEAAESPPPGAAPFAWTRPNIVWAACAAAYLLFVLGSLLWILVR